MSEAERDGGIAHWAFLRAFTAASRAQSKNALGQTYLLVGKNNVLRLDVPESDKPIAMDDVARSLKELPHVAHALVEGSGHRVETMFLSDEVDAFVKCPSVR